MELDTQNDGSASAKSHHGHIQLNFAIYLETSKNTHLPKAWLLTRMHRTKKKKKISEILSTSDCVFIQGRIYFWMASVYSKTRTVAPSRVFRFWQLLFMSFAFWQANKGKELFEVVCNSKSLNYVFVLSAAVTKH